MWFNVNRTTYNNLIFPILDQFMITNAKTLTLGETIEVDLLIIGAGPAGITIAKQFAGTSVRVIVLESGGESYDYAAQDLNRGVITGIHAEPLDASRLRLLGGTSNHWAGWCRPFEKEDFEAREDWPESGWPISKADLNPYYDGATELCQLPRKSFDDLDYWKSQSGGKLLDKLNLNDKRLLTSIFQISPPTRFGETYRQDLEQAKNIRVILNATVLELLQSNDSSAQSSIKKLSGARASTLEGKQFIVNAHSIVMAVGGVETSRLLLLSNKIHPDGAGNENDLVGRYFMDHPWLRSIGYLRFSKPNTYWPLYFDQTKVSNTRIFGTLTPSPELKSAKHIGGFRLWLQPSKTSSLGIDSARSIIQGLQHGQLTDDLGEHIANMYSDADTIADAAYKTLFQVRKSPFAHKPIPSDPYLGAFIDLNTEQQPNPDSRLTLDTTLDSFGQRSIKLDWRLTDTDWKTATTALNVAAQEFGRINAGRVHNPLEGDKPNWPHLITSSYHHMGGARMANNPKRGVVDADCRVHSIDNLYIAGSAVFPTSGYANPTLTIVALSLKLAAHLRGVLA